MALLPFPLRAHAPKSLNVKDLTIPPGRLGISLLKTYFPCNTENQLLYFTPFIKKKLHLAPLNYHFFFFLGNGRQTLRVTYDQNISFSM